MRNTLLIAAIAFLAYSCGDAGVGFNAGKEFPVSIPIDVNNIPGVPGVDPPAFTETITYELDDVGEFSDLDNLEEVLIEGISYEISGVEAAQGEDVSIQALSIELFTDGASIGVIDVAGDLNGTLANLPKSEITTIDYSAIAAVLERQGQVRAEVEFDFGEFPPSNFNFDFTFYFDVVIKVRNLGE